MSLKNRILTGAAWTAAGSWSTQLFLLFIFIFLARILNPEDFGLFAIVGIVIGLGHVIVNPGFTQAIISIEELPDGMASNAFWVSLILSLFLSILGFLVLSNLPPDVLPGAARAVLLVSLPVLVLATIFIIPQALLLRELRHKEVAISFAVGNCFGGISALLAAQAGLGVWALVVQLYVSTVLSGVVLCRYVEWRPAFYLSRAQLHMTISEGGHYFGVNALSYANRRLDNALVGALFGFSDLGVYVIAKKVFDLLSDLVMQPFVKIALPAFSRVGKNPEALKSAYQRMVTMTSLVTVPVFVGFILTAPDFMVLAFGDKWQPAIALLQILCVAGALRGVTLLTIPILTAMNLGRYAFRLHFANTLGNFAAYIIFMPLGLVGIGIGFTTRAIIFFLVTFYVLWRVANIRVLSVVKQILPIYVASVLMALLVWFLLDYLESPNSIVDLTLTVLAGILGYFVFLYFLARNNFLESVNLVRGYFR